MFDNDDDNDFNSASQFCRLGKVFSTCVIKLQANLRLSNNFTLCPDMKISPLASLTNFIPLLTTPDTAFHYPTEQLPSIC